MNALDVAAVLVDAIGPEAVSDNLVDRSAHVRDSWPALRQWSAEAIEERLPCVVVRPASAEQVSAVVRVARELRVPIVPYGRGSGVVGAAVPVDGRVISLDTARLSGIRGLDEESLTVHAEAGVLGSDLENYLWDRGYTLGHYPQSLHLSTVGGWVATRATGTFSNKYGGTEDLLSALEVVLATGEIAHTRDVPRSATGPRIADVFLGSEGTLGVVTHVSLRVLPRPESRIFQSLGFPSVEAGLTAIRDLHRAHVRPAVLRLYDSAEAEVLRPGSSSPLLVIGCDGPAAMTEVEMLLAIRICLRHGAQELGAELGERWERHRFDASWLERGNAQPTTMADAIEVSGSWPVLARIDRGVRAAVAPHVHQLMAHWSHFYPQGGCAYYIMFVEGDSPKDASNRYHQAWEGAMHAVLTAGGSIAHHHGIGLARNEFLRAELGDSFVVWEQIKDALDPDGIFNPGKLGL